MARLLLIRHAESEGNRDRTFTLTPDVPITDAGRRQAETAAEWIASRYRPAHVASSPFRRARQTADILAGRLGLPVSVEAELREQSYGDLAGRPYAALRECPDYDPQCYWQWAPPGGESLLAVATRAGGVLDRVAGAFPRTDVVVVSHGGVMMALWRHVTGEWRAGRVPANAAIVEVEHDAGRYLGARLIEGE